MQRHEKGHVTPRSNARKGVVEANNVAECKPKDSQNDVGVLQYDNNSHEMDDVCNPTLSMQHIPMSEMPCQLTAQSAN